MKHFKYTESKSSVFLIMTVAFIFLNTNKHQDENF